MLTHQRCIHNFSFSPLGSDEMINVPVLVMANKQDQTQSVRPREVAEKLHLSAVKGRDWRIRGTCAISGDGVYESIIELSEMVKTFQKTYRK